MKMKHRGFTLIEVMAVVAMMAIFSLGVFYFESGSFKIYSYEKEEADLQFDCKTAVTEISQDIKKAKQSEYSVISNFSNDDRFSTLFNRLEGNYEPIVYIEGMDGTNCIYAKKTDVSSNISIVRFEINSNSPFSLHKDENGKVESGRRILDYKEDFKEEDYPQQLSHNEIEHLNIPENWSCKFVYEQNGKFNLVYNIKGDSDTFEVPLDEKASSISLLQGSSGKVVAKNVNEFSVEATDGYKNNAYNITISLQGKKYPSIKKSYAMCVSKIKYEGDD
ncbi:hypothetical protein AGR56_04985 [Clostridium sp. DMHC 10]|uniref:PilW family protein n=1 Tax=Clostridium sp. DMHC 10 TaxID=747377 RepID=UPI0006C2AC93|nr:prepilin-type N-terminal cleavage/methylation domain-containing protein [Clostridium sp. DMHC 10]KOF56231.1 hypothetical protein AGR56_04985 [Clostridium sp. DMHC 10]